MGLDGAIDAAEGLARRPRRRGRRQPLASIVVLEEGEMGGQFARQFRLGAVAPDQRPEAQRGAACPGNHCGSASSSRSTSPVSLRQRAVSRPSARVPAAVMP